MVGDKILEIDRKNYGFKTKEIWFSDYPFDISGYDRVIFKNCKNKGDYKGFTRSESATLVIDLTKDLEVIWKDMHVNVRNKINKAMRQNIMIKRNQNYDDFDEIQRSFREKKGIGRAESIEILKKYGTLFVAEIEGEILGGVFYLEDDNNIRGWYAATKRLEVDKEKQKVISEANRLIEWETLKYAKAKGIKEYDQGGYYIGKEKDPQRERINVNKRTLGGELVTRYIYEKDYSIRNKIAKKIYKLKKVTWHPPQVDTSVQEETEIVQKKDDAIHPSNQSLGIQRL